MIRGITTMARFLIGFPVILMWLSVSLVLWLLLSDFAPAMSAESVKLAAPFVVRSVIYAVVSAAGQVAVGVLAALTVLWLARGRLAQLAMITVFLIPYAIPASVVGLAYRFGLGPGSAWAETMSPFLGVEPQFWLYDHTFEAAILASIWQFFPFAFLLSYLALRTIPPMTLRAAQLDGAPFRRMSHDIVLGRIWPVLAAIFALRLVFMLVKFDTPFIFTEKIQSENDVATVELWRAIGGSTSAELPVLAWALQLLTLLCCVMFLVARRKSLA